MKLNIFLLLLSIILFSCNNKGQNHQENKNAVTEKKVTASNENQIVQNFEDYWLAFSSAIQTNDTNRIGLLVEIPLRIMGREDQDPEFKLYDSEIVKYVLFFVNNGGYYDFEKDTSISNRSLLTSELKSISQYDKYSKNQWIGDFVFKETEKGWRLIVIYTDTKKLKVN